MRISVSEWTTLRIALKLPRALLNPELIAPALRRYALTRRGLAAVSLALVAVLVALHLKTADPAVLRLTDLSAQLAAARLIDARADAAIVDARIGAPASRNHGVDFGRVQRALDLAAAEAKTNALRSAIADLRKDYAEKAELAPRLEQASADSRDALAAAMRADAAVTGAIRRAWSDFPQRDRLVAAENLTVRVIAEAQQYHRAPTSAHRASLEASAQDLPKAQGLPKPVQAGLARLETDVHRVLLLKPLEHMLGERLAALRTGARLDEITQLFQSELAEALARRDRWRIALVVYSMLLALLIAYLIVRAIARYRDLEVLYAGQTRELAKALQRLRVAEGGLRVTELRRPALTSAEEDARIVSEHRRQENIT